MSEVLLDYVARKCSLYISNLRLSTNSAIILPIVRSLDAKIFSTDDWNRSLSYIFEEPLRFKTSEFAKQYYIKKLEMNLLDNKD